MPALIALDAAQLCSCWQIRITRWLLLAAWLLAGLTALPQLVNFHVENVVPHWPGGWMQCYPVSTQLDSVIS